MIYNEDELKREILILNETVKAQTNYISDFKLELEAEYKRGWNDCITNSKIKPIDADIAKLIDESLLDLLV